MTTKKVYYDLFLTHSIQLQTFFEKILAPFFRKILTFV
jgi:hypothetical protein